MTPSVDGVVRVEPAGVELAVQSGETIIEAAWRLGYYWPSVCFGQAQCTACHVVVAEGSENLSQVGDEEAQVIRTKLRTAALRHGDNLRLACRAEVHGRVVLTKRGVRPER